jgi:FlaA1/EpsC-like NDP-sugar epimerase
MKNLKSFFKNKDILVTGGCGSIGSEIVKQLLQFDVKRVRVFDHNESGQFHLQKRLGNPKRLRILIGDVRDKDRLKMAIKGVDIVFHAAALKHVPLCEYNPFEAVATNVHGTQNLVDVAWEEKVDRFISISTDKAVNPISTMGATKLLSEKVVLNASFREPKTKFSCVRFGNVLDSDGSVVPIFKEWIENGEPVRVTSKEMVRFFMSIPESINLILKAAQIMKGREIFVLKMNALKIIDLAEVMIEELAPKDKYKGKIGIKIIGIRPGEKIYEMLMTEEEAQYAIYFDNLFILRQGVITPHCMQRSPLTKPLNKKYYDARATRLLSKEEIRKLLYQVKIL